MKHSNYQSIAIISIALFLAFSLNVSAQKKNKMPSEPGRYTSLESALKADPLSVIKLDLSNSKLKEFPTVIFKFKNLQQLILTNNKLTSLPDNIGDFPYLAYLNVSKNKLTELPEGIGNLQSLNSFKMSQNKIKTLPESFFNLKAIEIIDFYSNPLSFDPDKFTKISGRIKVIDVRNTNLSKEQCQRLQEVLPKAKIKFDKGCNCHQ